MVLCISYYQWLTSRPGYLQLSLPAVSPGESIQILDIGLRKSPLRTVRHATPPTPDYKQPNPLLYKSGSSHSSSAIAQLSMPHHPILKGERSPSLPPQPTPFPPSSLNDHHPPDSDSEEFQRQQRQRSKSHDGTKRSRVYVNVSPRPPPSPKSPKQSTSSSAKPPRTLQEKSRRREGVHWAAQRAKRSGMVGDYSTGSLPQPLGKIPPPRIAYRLRKDSNSSDDSSPLSTLIAQEGLESIQGSAAAKSAPFSLRNGMQRSFRYRKIVLRQEKPIFKSVQEEDSSDDEDEETETESETSSLSSSRRILASSSPNLSEVGKSHISKTSRSGHHHLPGTAGCTQVQDYSYQPTSYSKVTVVGVKVASVSSEHHAKLHSQNKGEDSSSSEGTLPRRASDCFPLPPPSPSDTAFAEFESADCTEKHTSDTAVLHESTSLNSLDNILVDPPPMFEDPEDQLPPLPPPGYESSEQVSLTQKKRMTTHEYSVPPLSSLSPLALSSSFFPSSSSSFSFSFSSSSSSSSSSPRARLHPLLMKAVAAVRSHLTQVTTAVLATTRSMVPREGGRRSMERCTKSTVLHWFSSVQGWEGGVESLVYKCVWWSTVLS